MFQIIKVPGETHSTVVTQMVFVPAGKKNANFSLKLSGPLSASFKSSGAQMVPKVLSTYSFSSQVVPCQLCYQNAQNTLLCFSCSKNPRLLASTNICRCLAIATMAIYYLFTTLPEVMPSLQHSCRSIHALDSQMVQSIFKSNLPSVTNNLDVYPLAATTAIAISNTKCLSNWSYQCPWKTRHQFSSVILQYLDKF